MSYIEQLWLGQKTKQTKNKKQFILTDIRTNRHYTNQRLQYKLTLLPITTYTCLKSCSQNRKGLAEYHQFTQLYRDTWWLCSIWQHGYCNIIYAMLAIYLDGPTLIILIDSHFHVSQKSTILKNWIGKKKTIKKKFQLKFVDNVC